MEDIGLIAECGPYGANIAVFTYAIERMAPDLRVVTAPLENKKRFAVLLWGLGEMFARKRMQACLDCVGPVSFPQHQEALQTKRLRSEIDALIALRCGLTEKEFVHLVESFPLVDYRTKHAAHNGFRAAERVPI